jgi:hypothetical protein
VNKKGLLAQKQKSVFCENQLAEASRLPVVLDRAQMLLCYAKLLITPSFKAVPAIGWQHGVAQRPPGGRGHYRSRPAAGTAAV